MPGSGLETPRDCTPASTSARASANSTTWDVGQLEQGWHEIFNGFDEDGQPEPTVNRRAEWSLSMKESWPSIVATVPPPLITKSITKIITNERRTASPAALS